jgi:serine/threonine-protein kinase HipA
MTDELLVELYGTVIAVLRRDDGRMHLSYTSDALQRWGVASPVLSCAMPLSVERLDATEFVKNLLPENEHLRAAVGVAHGVSGEDHFGLIAAIGLDCAGAVRISREADLTARGEDLRPLAEHDVVELIRSLPRRPLGAARDVRLSLGGAQSKLLLVKTADGWALPLNGAASTHILKPEPVDMMRGYAANEGFCMDLARRCELTTAASEVRSFGGWDTYIVERYDRYLDADGVPRRLHQEDFCQALGRSGVDKYERVGERRLRDIARTVRRWASNADLAQLLRHAIFHAVIGNTDAHDKNYGLTHAPDGTVALAPMYDATCTTWQASRVTTMASSINGVVEVANVTAQDFTAEGKAWGIRRSAAIVSDALERISTELAASRLDATIDEDMVDKIKARALELLDQTTRPGRS